jgi:hypothetical protein
MRSPRVRFTVRGLMVAVAAAAILIGAETMRRRSERFRGMAERFGLLERACRLFYWGPDTPVDNPKAFYYADLRRKYERAARRPWLPVAPDPPEPEWSPP